MDPSSSQEEEEEGHPPRLTLKNAMAFHDPEMLQEGLVLLLPTVRFGRCGKRYVPRRAMLRAQAHMTRGDPTLLMELEVGLVLQLRPVWITRERDHTALICASIDRVEVRRGGRTAIVWLRLS